MDKTKDQIHQVFDDIVKEAIKTKPDWDKIKQAIENGVRGYSLLRRQQAEERRQNRYKQMKNPRLNNKKATDEPEPEQQILDEIDLVFNNFKNNHNKLKQLCSLPEANSPRGSKERRDWIEKVRNYGMGR